MTSENDIARIGNELIAAIRTVGSEKGLRGAEAGLVLKRAFPGFSPIDFGASTLREFIAKYVPDVCEKGASGLDPIYGLREWGASGPEEPSLVLAWRAWVSPGSPLAIIVDRKSGQIRLRNRHLEVAENEISVLPADAQTHRMIAERFVTSQDLDDQSRQTLQSVLEGERSTWWSRWSAALRGPCVAIAHRWAEHRRRELESELVRVLSEQGANEQVQTTVLRAIRIARDGNPKPSHQGYSQPQASQSTQPLDLRRISHAVIERMSEHELRALTLPVGLVLDAITNPSR